MARSCELGTGQPVGKVKLLVIDARVNYHPELEFGEGGSI